jgi:hypothetical protein
MRAEQRRAEERDAKRGEKRREDKKSKQEERGQEKREVRYRHLEGCKLSRAERSVYSDLRLRRCKLFVTTAR